MSSSSIPQSSDEYTPCSGQLMSISQQPDLFFLLATTYGGDGANTFALPDLRGRKAIGVGTGPGLTDRELGKVCCYY